MLIQISNRPSKSQRADASASPTLEESSEDSSDEDSPPPAISRKGKFDDEEDDSDVRSPALFRLISIGLQL